MKYGHKPKKKPSAEPLPKRERLTIFLEEWLDRVDPQAFGLPTNCPMIEVFQMYRPTGEAVTKTQYIRSFYEQLIAMIDTLPEDVISGKNAEPDRSTWAEHFAPFWPENDSRLIGRAVQRIDREKLKLYRQALQAQIPRFNAFIEHLLLLRSTSMFLECEANTAFNGHGKQSIEVRRTSPSAVSCEDRRKAQQKNELARIYK